MPQLLAPRIGMVLFSKPFEAAYADCLLAHMHSRDVDTARISGSLRAAVAKTVAVEELRCIDYERTRQQLLSFHVNDAELGLMELDVVRAQPQLMRYERH